MKGRDNLIDQSLKARTLPPSAIDTGVPSWWVVYFMLTPMPNGWLTPRSANTVLSWRSGSLLNAAPKRVPSTVNPA